MSSHLTIVSNPCDDFSCVLTWIIAISSYYNTEEWGTLVTAASTSFRLQLRPTNTRHPTRAYCSNKFSFGCCLALHLGNTRPCNFPLMTTSVTVNCSSNCHWSSTNTVDYLFFHQCRGTISLFGIGCTAAADALDSHFLLWLAPDRECTIDLCLKLSACNCGWAVRLKSIGLASVVDCKIVLRLLLLNLLVLRLFASKLSSSCFRVIQQYF